MTIYIIQLAVIILLQPLKRIRISIAGKTRRGEIVYLQVAMLILYIVMALRGRTVGTDTSTYLNMYKRITEAGTFSNALNVSSISSAPVYVLYLFLLSRISNNLRLMIIMNSLVICLGVYRIIKKQSSNYFLSIFLFITLTLYYESMNGSRQFMAIVMAVNAYIIIKENARGIRGWLLLVLALGTHITVAAFFIIFVGDLITKKVQSERRIMFLTLLISVMISMMFGLIVQLVLNFFPAYSTYVNGTFTTQIFDNDGSGRIVLLYAALLITLIYCGVNINIRHNDWGGRREKGNINSFYFACVFCAVSGILFSKNVLFNRILWPFLFCFILYIPDAFRRIKAKEKQVVLMGLSMILLVYCFFHLYEDKSSIIPYIMTI